MISIDELRRRAKLYNEVLLGGITKHKKRHLHSRLIQIHGSDTCWICNRPASPVQKLADDHDHDTALQRGLLCTSCNLGLGKFRHDPDALFRAAIYMQTFKIMLTIDRGVDPLTNWLSLGYWWRHLRGVAARQLLATSDQENAEAEQAQTADH